MSTHNDQDPQKEKPDSEQSPENSPGNVAEPSPEAMKMTGEAKTEADAGIESSVEKGSENDKAADANQRKEAGGKKSGSESSEASTEGDGGKPPGFFRRSWRAIKQWPKRFKAFLRRYRVWIAMIMVIIAFVLVYFWPQIFITVNSGQAGVLFRRFSGGTVTNKIYSEGFHVIFPWDTMYIYDIRTQEIKHQIQILAKDGLRIDINLSIRYQPIQENMGTLHKLIGPDYVQKIVIPEVEAIVRSIGAQYKPIEMITTKMSIIQEILREGRKEIGEKLIVVDDILIRSIELPPTIKEAIEAKLRQEQMALEYDFRILKERKEAERKRIEALGIKDFQDIVSAGISQELLRWKGIEATLELSKSPNSKVIVVGTSSDGMPIILGADK